VYQFMSDCKHCPWTDLAIQGVQSKVLYVDESSGQQTVVTKMAPGAVIPRHLHSHADETVYVLEGDFIEEGTTYGDGAYFIGKSGIAHGPHKTKNGCTVLTHWTGGIVDFVES
jgi:quercetin dioxygenase-like cupin family protein